MKIRGLRSLLGAVAFTLVLAIPRTAPAQSVFVINAIMPLTGPLAFSGTQEAEALQIFERFANGHGGLRGQPIHFNILDDGSSAQQAVQLFTQVMAQHPAVVLGISPSQACAALAPLAKDGPVLYCASPSINAVPNGFVFAASMALPQFDRGMIRYLRLKGWKRLAILSSIDLTGQSNDEATRSILALPENRDLSVVDWEHFNTTDLNVAAQVANMRAARPQAIIAWVSGTAFGTVLRSLHDTGLDVPITTSGANVNAEQLMQYTGYLPSEMALPAFPYLVPSLLQATPLKKPVDDLIAAYGAAGAKISPGGPGYVWDAATIILNGLRKSGPNASAAELRDDILGLRRFPGIDGVYNFDSGDQHGLADENVVMVRFEPKTQSWVAVSGLGGVPIEPK